MLVHTILYVSDQEISTSFYRQLLQLEAILNVPGMTEFKLSEKHILGLMPENGIRRLLGDKLPDPSRGVGIPRVELYIRTDDPESYFERSKKLGAYELSKVLPRNWGDRVGYVMDRDGHVLAFASLNIQK